MTLFDLSLDGFPFRLQIAPAEAVAHRSWLRAREAALQTLRRGEPVAVLGRPGTGKSLLLQSIAQELRDAGIVIVDEADTVPRAELIALRESGTPFVVAALPGTDIPLPHVRVTLEPLSAAEVASVVAERLVAAGRRADYFEPDATLELASQSGGLMRLVLILAGAATFFAEHEELPRVTRQHIAEAAAMRDVAQAEDGPVAPAGDLPVTGHARRTVGAGGRRTRVLLGVAMSGLVLAGLWAATQLPGKSVTVPSVASANPSPRSG